MIVIYPWQNAIASIVSSPLLLTSSTNDKLDQGLHKSRSTASRRESRIFSKYSDEYWYYRLNVGL
ncbi:hypothetical protein [Cylindrospermum stagnale]|uniref:hypothetical protein n=1 Tax=Cylindrospermum stagnale TaxID=142864 RepID=UPI0002D3C3F4|nr:hypothetical protein [Cylindrospermum stagnale]